ncbi:hypothetical protein VNO78_12831 [Psophocarpus tetragonolobus]|uniref:DNA replication ATP-dependent helicase/nuclease n=1 Tax=Psophocarpus tetragonolobus TaxID=3891 RepID=A0AAN9XPP4_PSOTE
MGPRKKKPNLQQQQPSKFGIQHFFERASQKQQQELQPHTNTIPITNNTPPSQQQQPTKVSPQNRSRFSPGMLVKQSQDDGADEVTWKISPVNERLQAVSKQTPEVIKALAASSKINLSPIRGSDRGKETCADKFIISPAPKVPLSFKRINSACDVSGQSPFRTPPSYRPDKVQRVKDIDCIRPCNKLLLRQNKKALLELLDQVEDAIAVDDDTVCNKNIHSFKVPQDQIANELPVKVNPAVERTKSHIHKVPQDQIANELPVKVNPSVERTKSHIHNIPQDEIANELPVKVNPVVEKTKAHTHKVSQDQITNVLPVKVNPAVGRTKSHIPKEVVEVFSDSNYLVLEVTELRSADSCAAQPSYKVLRLLNEQTGEERAVNLHNECFHCKGEEHLTSPKLSNSLSLTNGVWGFRLAAFHRLVAYLSDSVVAPGDTVHIIGQFDERGNCDIDHDKNLLIVHPDILLSGTRAGLTKDNPMVNFMEDYAEVVLQRNIESLYACGVNENDVRKTLRDAIPRILSWITEFKNMKERIKPNVNFGYDDGPKNVGISEVIDIEEMAWAPKYGLKGMIDASVSVKIRSQKDELEEKIMPVEFKTGKPPNSQSLVEHKAQVILYTLLMSERYQKTVDSGLLYYLQSDQTQGVVVQRSDLTGLIMRRNELASDVLKALTLQQLPPMLQSSSICRGCRHLNVCSIYHKAHGGNTGSSGLGEVFDSLTNHLTSLHSKFLRHWDHLIDLEAKVAELLNKEVWQSHSSKSPNSGGLYSIVLDASQGIPYEKSLKDNQFIYRFIQQESSSSLSGVSDVSSSAPLKNDLDFTLRSGDHVILSNQSSRQVVAKGVIFDISPIHVSVSFSKCLRIPGSSSTAHDLIQQVWRIDKDEYVSSFAIMRFNLVQLFLQNDRSAHLRRMIVDLEAPRFDNGSVVSQDPAISYVSSEKSLNDDQRRAILKILAAKDYALILGMPGTGKTSTLVHAVKALLIRGTSILLTAYTNSAVDNLLVKLKAQGIDFVRIGRHDVVNEEVKEHCLSATNAQGVEDIKIRLEQVKVVAVTCLGICSPLLSNMRFDVCIMDEAGQTTLPVSLGPLTFASMFVLVGDHYQLPPLVQSEEARENGMGVSLFCRLSEAHPEAILALQSQYRMCQDIMDLSNALIYGDRLRCGSFEVANAKLEFSDLNCDLHWLEDVLNPQRPVIFINTDKLPALETRDQKTVNNPIEAHIIAEIANELVKNGIGREHIGIITPYNSQANLIRRAVSMTSLEIHTIDKYQGRDKDCILVSFVRSMENPTSCAASLLGDWHRINVALTRAKKKLIMVGSRRTLVKVPLLKLLIKKVEEQSGILSVDKKDIDRKGELKRCSQMR